MWMAWDCFKPTDIDEFCSCLLKFSDDDRYACRGQSRRYNDELFSSLDRILKRDPPRSEEKCAHYEYISMYMFHERARTYLDPSEHDHLGWLMGTLLLIPMALVADRSGPL